jgi:Recombinase zinc beta ribbon domain/Recombinase
LKPYLREDHFSGGRLHHILSDPVYTGTAYANRFEYVVPKKPRRRAPRSGERTSRRPRPPEQWIAVPVPALVDQRTWDGIQARLARNAATSFRRNKKHDYLLRCLLRCGTCGLGIHGCYFPGHGGRRGRRYYRCAGTDPLTTGRETKCPRARIEADALERVVWDHVAGLLSEPVQLLAQFERFLAESATADRREELPDRQLRARLDRLDRADRRLLEAYQAEVITLEELSAQRRALAEQRRIAEQHREQHRRLRERGVQAAEALVSLTAFCERVRSRLPTASITERQAILQLVVERIIVHEDSLEIHHVVPLRGSTPGIGGPLAELALRSDGVRPARRLEDRSRLALRGVEPVEPGVGVRLQDAGEAGQVPLGMLATAIRGIEERDRWRIGPAERPVIPDVAPHVPDPGPLLGQHRDRGVIAVQPLGGEDVGPDRQHQRHQAGGRRTHPVGEGADIDLHPFPGVDRALAVQRQVLAVLRGQHQGEQVGAGPAAGDRVRGRRRLADRLA